MVGQVLLFASPRHVNIARAAYCPQFAGLQPLREFARKAMAMAWSI
jgi:hypothetical protein